MEHLEEEQSPTSLNLEPDNDKNPKHPSPSDNQTQWEQGSDQEDPDPESGQEVIDLFKHLDEEIAAQDGPERKDKARWKKADFVRPRLLLVKGAFTFVMGQLEAIQRLLVSYSNSTEAKSRSLQASVARLERENTDLTDRISLLESSLTFPPTSTELQNITSRIIAVESSVTALQLNAARQAKSSSSSTEIFQKPHNQKNILHPIQPRQL